MTSHTWHYLPGDLTANTATLACTCGWISDPYPAEPRASAHYALHTRWAAHCYRAGVRIAIDGRSAA